MNKKLIFKIIIDVAMTLLFLILLFPFTTGLAFHEIAGLVILGIFAVHFILNFKWVAGITRKFFDPNTPASTRGKYILNLAILLNALLVIVTGILISVELFPNIPRTNTPLLAAVHKISSYTCGGMLLIHLALHKNYLVNAFKKMFSNKKGVLIPSLSVFAAMIVTGLIAWKAFPTGDSSSNDMLLDESGSSINTLSKDNSEAELGNAQITTPSAEDVISLDEYLGDQICTACSMRCPLSAPQCARGEVQAEAAIQKYAALYEVTLSEVTSAPQAAAETQAPASAAVLTLPETTTTQQTTTTTTAQITAPIVTEAPQTTTTITTTPAQTEAEISLEEYLSKIICTACPKRCLLSNPRCGRGERQAEEATQQYNATYGANA